MKKTIKCSHCGNEITDNNNTFEVYGKAICGTCADNETVTCDCCGCLMWYYDDVGDDDTYLCEECISFYTRCEICYSLTKRSNAIRYKDTVYCNKCYTKTLEDEEAEKHSV